MTNSIVEIVGQKAQSERSTKCNFFCKSIPETLLSSFMVSDLRHKLKLKLFTIYVIVFFALGFPIFAQSTNFLEKNCASSNDYSTKVVIIGDSFFTTNKGRLGSLESYLSKFIEGACVENLANSGARFSGFGSNRIQKQMSKSTPELLVIGGGGNDLIKCGSDFNCMQRTLNKILSPDVEKGYLTDTIALNSDLNTKVIVVYPSEVAPHAPNAWKTVVKNIGHKYGSRMARYAEKNPKVFWLDATLVAKTNVPSHWLKDGYHPSVVANMRLAKTIEKIHRGDITHTISDYIDTQYDTKFSCSFSIHKSGYDDKQSSYEYLQVEGELDIGYDLNFEEHTIRYTRENWRISGASPTYLRDNMKDALFVHADGDLYGALNTYSNTEASGTVLVSTDHYVFESSNNSEYLFEGQHVFKNPKNDEAYRFKISGCND